MRAPRISCAADSFCIAEVLVRCSVSAFGQTDSGTVSGRVLDPADRSVPGVQLRFIDIDRGTAEKSTTNNAASTHSTPYFPDGIAWKGRRKVSSS